MRSTLAFLALAVSFASPGLSAAEELEESAKAHFFPRSTYAWPFATGPVYGDVDASRWSEPGVLHTMVGSFEPEARKPRTPRRAARWTRTPPYVILQVDPATYADGRFDRIRGLLEGQGGALLEAMAVAGYLVRVGPRRCRRPSAPRTACWRSSPTTPHSSSRPRSAACHCPIPRRRFRRVPRSRRFSSGVRSRPRSRRSWRRSALPSRTLIPTSSFSSCRGTGWPTWRASTP